MTKNVFNLLYEDLRYKTTLHSNTFLKKDNIICSYKILSL